MQAYQQKTEKFFVSEEKKFDRIDSRYAQNIIQNFFYKSTTFVPLHFNFNHYTVLRSKLAVHNKALQKAANSVFRTFAKYRTQPFTKILNVLKISRHNQILIFEKYLFQLEF